MSEYNLNKLSAEQRRVYNMLYEAIGSRQETFNVDVVDIADVTRAYEAFSYDHPEIFYVDFYNVKMTQVSPGRSKVELRYFYTKDETAHRKAMLESSVNKMLDNADFAKADELGRCRLIHDRLVRSVTYENNAAAKGRNIPDALTIEGVFLRGAAVCEGIAKAVTFLGERLGMDIPAVTGEAASDGATFIPHVWNLVRIGGVYAHLDVTWDIILSTPLKFTRYDYFCLPDVDMRADHNYGGLMPCINGRGMTFFERSNREFHDMESCKHLISDKLKERSNVIYFKYVDHTMTPEMKAKRMDDAVNNMLRLRSLFMFDLETSHNAIQGVYFYRILKRL